NVILAAIALVALVIERGEIDADVAQRTGLDQRINAGRRETGAVREDGNGKIGGKQRLALIDESAVQRWLVVALQENALQRRAEVGKLVDDFLEELHRH